MQYTAVVFDLFGTLVDDFAVSVGQMNAELVAALGVPDAKFSQLWGEITEMRTNGAFQTVEASIEYVCAIMGAQVSAQQVAQAADIRLRYTRRALDPRPNAVATLMRLKSAGCKLGLLSNCSIEIPILWGTTAFAEFIETPIFSSRERLKKPDPRIYQLACERLGIAPECCLYVADGENYELNAAAKAGLHPVLIRTPAQDSRSELHREAREWQGNKISTLPDVLRLVGLQE
jgi:putative hydrolase of the HAD superfamily